MSDLASDALWAELRRRLQFAERSGRTNILLMGPPGGGKGTAAHRLKKDFSFCHISTGDFLRQAILAGKTPDADPKQQQIGKESSKSVSHGALVSDETVIDIVEEAIQRPECRKGFVLDGFPRNINQAKALDDMLGKMGIKLDVVVHMQLSDSESVARSLGRLLHPDSGRQYHKYFNPPAVPGKDDVTADDLVWRADDSPNSCRRRLETFASQTQPVFEYYHKQGIVQVVDAEVRDMELVYRRLKAAIAKSTGCTAGHCKTLEQPPGQMQVKLDKLRKECELLI